MTVEEGAVDVANPRLTEGEIDALAPHGSRRRLSDGEALFRAGERRGGFYVVIEGAIEVVDRSGGESRRVALHGPGEFTGDIDILTRRRPIVGAVARGATEVLGVSSSDIRTIIGERPRVGELILRAFIARREELLESGFGGLRVIGSGTSRETFRLREFVSRNQVPFSWIDTDEEPGIGEILADFGVGTEDLPVVAVGERPLMRNPSTRELADVLGLRRPIRREAYDLVIIGAGPGGLGAAVYGASEGLETLVLEEVAPGGQAGASTRIENYLGFPTGITGAELIGRATLQAQKFNAELSSPDRVVGLDLEGAHPAVLLESGEHATARCVLIATGAEYRKLDIPERERFDGAGVFYAATPTELSGCRGSDVVVVGGGNSAGQAVIFLAEHTRSVHLLLRGDDLRHSMSSYLASQVEATPNIMIHHNTEIRELIGEDLLEGAVVENTRSGERRTFHVPAVFSFIGAVPRTDWLRPKIDTDEHGFIRTGRTVAGSGTWTLAREPYLLETSHPGIFAAGDVRSGSVPRVSSAVGEGAMAVKFAHAFLADG